MLFDEGMEDRLITSAYTHEDAETETGLRPRVLDEYVGQTKVKENLKVVEKSC